MKRTDEWHRDSRQHHRAGVGDGAATCAFAQRQTRCACAKRHLPTTDAVVSVAEASVSQWAGTEQVVSPLSQLRNPGGRRMNPRVREQASRGTRITGTLIDAGLTRGQARLQRVLDGVSARADKAWSVAGMARQVAQGSSYV